REYPAVHYLPRLLGDSACVVSVTRQQKLLLLHEGSGHAAVLVDEVIGNREVIIKGVGPQLSGVPGILGATALGDGRSVLILNPVQLAHRGEAAIAAPRTAARAANRLDIETFRTLSPAEQARALAGQSEPVRTGLLQQLSKAEQTAFIEADGALQLSQAPHGLADCPDIIVGDDLLGLSEFDGFIPQGTHAAKLTAAEIEALIAKAPPYTSAELLARLDLVYSGRIPRLVMDADTARAMFQVMVEHFKSVKHRLPTAEELAPLIQALDGTTPPNIAAPSVAATIEAPFGYGPNGTIASKPLPKGELPDWLKAQGAGAEALPPELLQPPKLHEPPVDAPRPDISSMGTVRND
ncbi:MAG: chemotaxis protein CheW, partial [Gammaproteobacteria bacterium]